MDKLPREIASNIFSELPFDSVLQYKSVSKSWYSLIQLILYTNGELDFARKHSIQTIQNHNYSSDSSLPDSVLLMFDKSIFDNNNELQLHYAEYNEDSRNGDFNFTAIKKLNCPIDMINPNFWKMAASSNGLICSYIQQTDSSYLFYIYNPFLGEYVTLPPPNNDNFNYSVPSSRMAFGFGHIPSTDEYKVVAIYYGSGDDVVGNIEVYTLGGGKNQWKSKGNMNLRLMSDSAGVAVNGTVYWLTVQKDEDGNMEMDRKHKKIVAFYLSEEKLDEDIQIPVYCCNNFKMMCWSGVLWGIEYKYKTRKHVSHLYERQVWWDVMSECDWNDIWADKYEHELFWASYCQALVWTSKNLSSVVSKELGYYQDYKRKKLKVSREEMACARLFHGLFHIKTFVSLTALGQNNTKTIKH